MAATDVEQFYPKSKEEWRKWLEINHIKKDAVWLISYKKKANMPTITWSESVDEALCFGWIDSLKKTLDEERSIQFFSKRKPKSNWSKINKEKIAVLTKSGAMTEAGLKCVEIAKENGSWTILDTAEALIVPEDLKMALENVIGATEYFTNLSKSKKKILLTWIVMAKRPETRIKRITEIVENASENLMPKPFR